MKGQSHYFLWNLVFFLLIFNQIFLSNVFLRIKILFIILRLKRDRMKKKKRLRNLQTMDEYLLTRRSVHKDIHLYVFKFVSEWRRLSALKKNLTPTDSRSFALVKSLNLQHKFGSTGFGKCKDSILQHLWSSKSFFDSWKIH